MEWSFTRYLSAKKTVDDRALNRRVWDVLREEIKKRDHNQAVRVLELGMGIGTMFQRLLESEVFTSAQYIGIDSEGENVKTANRLIPSWAAAQGWDVHVVEENGWKVVQNAKGTVTCQFLEADLFEFLQQERYQNHFDLIVANAVLDLVPLERVLPMIWKCLSQEGLGYFSINFDGLTSFEPTIESELDETIIAIYHQSMDERRINGQLSGDSRTGRHLFHALIKSGFEVIEAGSSDWLVFPRRGQYPADEAYFLHFILHFFEETIPKYPQINPTAFEDWLRRRRSQIDKGELVYLAHQLDYLVRKP
jgi:hypothetical protein